MTRKGKVAGKSIYSGRAVEYDRRHMQSSQNSFRAAFTATIPVFFGYMSIGTAFGFLLVRSGIEWFWAPIMSLTVFAGAAQFMAVGMISAGMAPIAMAIAVFMINARHMVYGLSLLDRFSRFRRFKPYLIFALTDETYGLMTTIEAPEGSDPEKFDFYISLFDQMYWVLGSTFGAVFGSVLTIDAPGIEFSMTALFTVLLVEQVMTLHRPEPFLIALGICVGLYILGFASHDSLLLLAISLSAAAAFFIPAGNDPAKGDDAK